MKKIYQLMYNSEVLISGYFVEVVMHFLTLNLVDFPILNAPRSVKSCQFCDIFHSILNPFNLYSI